MTERVTRIITETLASGIEPLTRVYSGVYDGYGETPVAYVTGTRVFTTETGVLIGYEPSIEKTEVGARWSLSNVKSAVRALQKLTEKDVCPAFVTAPVTESFLAGDVKSNLDSIELGSVNPRFVCLTFSEKALLKKDEKVLDGISTARAMGYQTAIFDFSGAQSLAGITDPVAEKLFLDPSVTALIGDRNKPGVFTALVGLLKALRMELILCGVKNDDVIREATAAECLILPDPDYSGEFRFPKAERSLDEIVTDGEGAL